MADIGARDAKTHLPELLARVQKGERFTITKHGRPVAELVPYVRHNAERAGQAIIEIRSMRQRLAKRGVQLKDVLKRGESLRDLAHEAHRL